MRDAGTSSHTKKAYPNHVVTVSSGSPERAWTLTNDTRTSYMLEEDRVCFLTVQVLEFMQECQLGDLLTQIKPMYTYLNTDEAPATEEERVADDLATNAGTVFDYGPEDFSAETLLEVIQHIHKTDPEEKYITVELHRQIQKAFHNIKEAQEGMGTYK